MPINHTCDSLTARHAILAHPVGQATLQKGFLRRHTKCAVCFIIRILYMIIRILYMIKAIYIELDLNIAPCVCNFEHLLFSALTSIRASGYLHKLLNAQK